MPTIIDTSTMSRTQVSDGITSGINYLQQTSPVKMSTIPGELLVTPLEIIERVGSSDYHSRKKVHKLFSILSIHGTKDVGI